MGAIRERLLETEWYFPFVRRQAAWEGCFPKSDFDFVTFLR